MDLSTVKQLHEYVSLKLEQFGQNRQPVIDFRTNRR